MSKVKNIEKKYAALTESIALNVREIRNRRGYTQEQLAERAGLHRTRVVEIEGQRYVPLLRTILILAESLGVEIEELVRVRPSGKIE